MDSSVAADGKGGCFSDVHRRKTKKAPGRVKFNNSSKKKKYVWTTKLFVIWCRCKSEQLQDLSCLCRLISCCCCNMAGLCKGLIKSRFQETNSVCYICSPYCGLTLLAETCNLKFNQTGYFSNFCTSSLKFICFFDSQWHRLTLFFV